MQNKQWLIDSLPNGKLEPDHFRLVESPLPETPDGSVLCRTLAIGIGAGTRAGLQGSASYAGAPTTGVPMNGTTVARVVASRCNIAEGALVICGSGWQTHAVHAEHQVQPIPDDGDPARYLGLLGTNGLTAYFGLLEYGRPESGKTLLVSAAAGSVGHIVGQIGRIKGARVVGVCGSDAKCDRLTGELGFDEALNYKDPDFRARLKAATPSGVDIYFDNTGGVILGNALFRMNNHGRIVCCGVVSQYDTSDPAPGPKGIPGLLVNKRLTMSGFLVFDHAHHYDDARAQLSAWANSGDLVAWQDEYDGFESAPQAFVDLLGGGNTGTRIVRVPE